LSRLLLATKARKFEITKEEKASVNIGRAGAVFRHFVLSRFRDPCPRPLDTLPVAEIFAR